jgi:riboflavin transporter FmnP
MEQTQTATLAEKGQEEASPEANKKKSSKFSNACKNYFTATRIAYIAVFTALAYVLYMPIFEFNIIPAVPFLKVDFSNTFVMIAGFSLGPVAAIVVGVLKEVLHALTFSQTVGIGELSNIIVMLPYVLIPAIVYKKHKGIKVVVICLFLGCLAQTLMSIPVNYFINFPFFFGFNWEAGMSYYLSVWYWVVLFNFVKTMLISAAVMLLYKPLSRLIKLTNKKFSQRKEK